MRPLVGGQLVFLPRCLATTLKGEPCQNINFIKDGRCPSHRNVAKFPIPAKTLTRATVEMVAWRAHSDEWTDKVSRWVDEMERVMIGESRDRPA